MKHMVKIAHQIYKVYVSYLLPFKFIIDLESWYSTEQLEGLLCNEAMLICWVEIHQPLINP